MFIVLALGMMMQATDGTAPPLREVATALAKIDAAVEIGVLRPQFADLLQQHLPPAIALLKSPPAGLHPDALAAVRQAVNAYGDALGSWRFAGMYVARGQASMAYALMLESQPAAARESSAPRSLRPGDTIEGRFGDGDDVDSGGGYRDVYDVAIGADGQYRLLFSSKICSESMGLLPVHGKRGDWKVEPLTQARVYKLKAGSYQVTVRCGLAEVGPYTLTFSEFRAASSRR